MFFNGDLKNFNKCEKIYGLIKDTFNYIPNVTEKWKKAVEIFGSSVYTQYGSVISKYWFKKIGEGIVDSIYNDDDIIKIVINKSCFKIYISKKVKAYKLYDLLKSITDDMKLDISDIT